MANRKKAAPAESKPRKASTKTKAASLFEVTVGGSTKIVEAVSKAEVKRTVLAGFSIRKLGPNEAFQAGSSGAKIEPLAGASELGIG